MCYLALSEEYGLDKGDKALQEINTHERECALRYERIEERLKDGSRRFDRLENMIWGVYAAVFIAVAIPILMSMG
jgi:cell division protein FtsL